MKKLGAHKDIPKLDPSEKTVYKKQQCVRKVFCTKKTGYKAPLPWLGTGHALNPTFHGCRGISVPCC